jgi:hypothetical protein
MLRVKPRTLHVLNTCCTTKLYPCPSYVFIEHLCRSSASSLIVRTLSKLTAGCLLLQAHSQPHPANLLQRRNSQCTLSRQWKDSPQSGWKTWQITYWQETCFFGGAGRRGRTGLWTQGLAYARQALLLLESLYQPFCVCVMVFFEIGSHKLFAWGRLNHDLPDLCFLSS